MNNIFLPNILIIGDSGSGKSYSQRNLPKESTCIIDTEQKGFPYRDLFPNVEQPLTAQEFNASLDKAKADPKIKYIVIDSLTEVFRKYLLNCRTQYKGYEIYGMYASMQAALFSKLKSRNQLFFVQALPEVINVVQTNGTQASKRVCSVLQGKEWEGKVESQFLITLFTDINPNVQPKFGFLTNSDGVTSAKSPVDMFKDVRIDNDLAKVADAIKKYYPYLSEKGF